MRWARYTSGQMFKLSKLIFFMRMALANFPRPELKIITRQLSCSPDQTTNSKTNVHKVWFCFHFFKWLQSVFKYTNLPRRKNQRKKFINSGSVTRSEFLRFITLYLSKFYKYLNYFLSRTTDRLRNSKFWKLSLHKITAGSCKKRFKKRCS